MKLADQQLEVILTRAFPGSQLTNAKELASGVYALQASGMQPLLALPYPTSQAARTAAAALRMLSAEFDLPIPQLQASDPTGETVGVPYLLVSGIGGEPLANVVASIGEEQLYQLGRRLGEIVSRVHRLACPHYGALEGDDPIAHNDERQYGLARFDYELLLCEEHGILDRQKAEGLRIWFQSIFSPIGRQPALICGGIGPYSILVRYYEGNWQVSGLLGWEHAQGWCPAWEHVTCFEATSDPRFFSLRVGYGNSYDELTKRTYEQVREPVMQPYRVMLVLQRMREAYLRGEVMLGQQLKGVLQAMVQASDKRIIEQ
jgi:hypothetical protein